MAMYPVKPANKAKGARWVAGTMPAIAVAATFAFAFAVVLPGVCRAEVLDPQRQAQLISLVRQDCGSCHGLTLKGGLGPALLPSTLQEQTMETLKAVILHGRPGTAMPPWQRFLSDEEAEWIVVNLQKGFPGGR